MKQVVFITGAGSGIGEALALEYASRGEFIVLFGRREDRLREVASRIKTEAIVCAGDVNSDEDLKRAVGAAIAKWGRLDVAIANAGFGVVGELEELTLEDWRRQFETNFFGLLRTCYATIPALKASKGKLAFVGSIVSYISAPGRSPYAASKYAVRAVAEALRLELAPACVSVTLLSPGMVESELRRVDNEGRFHAGAKTGQTMFHVPAHKAARAMVRAIEWRCRESVITGHGKVLVFVARHAPWLLRLMFKLGVRGRQKVTA